MQDKKSQITIFIIMGLVIICFVGLYFYISVHIEKGESWPIIEDPAIEQPVKLFVESCLKKTAQQGIYFIGMQGGYYAVPDFSEKFSIISVPYYFYHGNLSYPSKHIIESELSDYVADNIESCINDFSIFQDGGYEVYYENITVNTSINKNVIMMINYPIKLIKSKSVIEINEFIINIDFNLLDKYQVVESLIAEQNKAIDSIPLSSISYLAYLNNFSYAIVNIDANSILYRLIFNISSPFDKQFIYNFMVKYNWTSISPSSFSSINISDLGNHTAIVGYNFSYKINATGSNLEFTDYTDIFDIDTKSGLIEFNPDYDDVGFYNILLSVDDETGNRDFVSFNIEVTTENKAPLIDPIGFQEIVLGIRFEYQVNASDPNNDTILYFINSALDELKIDMQTGSINYIPVIDDVGLHPIEITVIDLRGLYDKEFFNLEVKNEQ